MKHTLSRIRQVFLDMDGTIYCGKKLFPTTIPFLEFLKSRGIGWTFLSNNSSYGAGEYAARLESFGIRSRPEEFYISTDFKTGASRNPADFPGRDAVSRGGV